MPKPKTPTSDTDPAPAAADAAKDDDAGGVEMVPFQYLGITFQVPKFGDDWDSNAWIALLRGADYQAAEFQLSATDQWKVVTTIAPTRGELKKFVRVFRDFIRESCDFS